MAPAASEHGQTALALLPRFMRASHVRRQQEITARPEAVDDVL
jgi:hypothetical protein